MYVRIPQRNCNAVLLNGSLEAFEAVCTDELALEVGDVACVAAEDAGRFVLLENDLVGFDKDLNGIASLHIEGVSDFDRQYYTTEFVNLSYNTGRFHVVLLFIF